MRHDSEKGQAILLVLVALSIFLLGAVGLAIDTSQMYSQRQMAQAAADGAAQAGILSIFDKTNTAAFNNAFGAPGDGAFNCTTTNAGLTPCAYALSNGFGGSSNDVVTVDFPTTAAGVTLSTVDPVNLIRVRITRTLPTGLIQFVGPSTSKITATATAAILAIASHDERLLSKEWGEHDHHLWRARQEHSGKFQERHLGCGQRRGRGGFVACRPQDHHAKRL